MRNKKLKDLIEFYKTYMPENVALVKNKERHAEVEVAITEIGEFAKSSDPKANITIEPDELTGTSMTLEIVADLIVVDMIDKFCDALKKADNFEVYPRTDGKIGLGVVFENVFKAAPPANEPFPEYYKDEE